MQQIAEVPSLLFRQGLAGWLKASVLGIPA
jgi:hypothetical protein